MTVERKPLLAFGPATIGERARQKQRDLPHLSTPSTGRQGRRLRPQFKHLAEAFNAERARLEADTPNEVDPALVIVFDLAGSVKDFRNAINRIDGLEFLSEIIGEQSEPDEDFHMVQRDNGRTDQRVSHSLYLVMSNAKACNELIKLFEDWQKEPSTSFAHGLGKFKTAFQQLVAVRRWGPEDRIRETGLREEWEAMLAVVGQSVSTVKVEIELWHRRDPGERSSAEAHVKQIVISSGGRVLDRAYIGEIGYHALLAELPIQQVESLVKNGSEAIRLLTTDKVMFVSPFVPMSIIPETSESIVETRVATFDRIEGKPRVALLDGLPFANHDLLRGRLLIDDPDGLGNNYPVAERHHGTAMASLIIHGDLSADGRPLNRPLYVRPILQPHEFLPDSEQVMPDRLLTDLLHRAIRRIVEGEGGHEAAAPSVRIVNLSIGVPSRALTSRMSPVGRLLDWLAVSYNLLFVVSAGNHTDDFTIPADDARNAQTARSAATQLIFQTSLLRGILPPGDALNVLTVGATHSDNFGTVKASDTVWDITYPDAPALYEAIGPGVDRSIKPDIHHMGGRALYERPVIQPGQTVVPLRLAHTALPGPGLQVATPDSRGAMNRAIFSCGTSNAAALVTREASRLFDTLEAGTLDREDGPLPDARYHPLLVRALLAHASSWGSWYKLMRDELKLSGQDARRQLTALLGYGRLDTSQLGTAATNRAVLVAGGDIGFDQRHTYELPLPPSLSSKADWHRFTITLAFAAPTVGQLMRYRTAKVYFQKPDMSLAGGNRIDAEHLAVRRGSLQQEIIEGSRAMTFADGDTFPIHVECMDDAQHLQTGNTIRICFGGLY